MSKLNICRAHDLGLEECKNVAEELLGKLVDRFGGEFSQKGEDYVFKHPIGVNASVTPTDSELSVDVKLGLMSRAMAPKIDKEINRVLDEKIGASD